MSNIRQPEILLLEKVLEMNGGYVLDFSNNSFKQFIWNVCKIDIYTARYAVFGESKAKRLKTFWQIESDQIVGLVINELLAYLKARRRVSGTVLSKEDALIFNDCLKVAFRLRGVDDKTNSKNKGEISEEEFLKREFKSIALEKLEIEWAVIEIIKSRLIEIQKSLNNASSLSAIIMSGSVLEGVLLGVAQKNMREFNQSASSPKSKETGKVLPFQDWTLSNLIDVAHDVGLIGLDVKKFSHALRDFRNYIHPYQQMHTNFSPDNDTAKISWQVLQAAISDLTKTK